MFTQTRANYRSIDLRRFRSLGQIRRFCRDHRPVSQLPKKPTLVTRSRARRPLGRFENIFEVQIPTPVVNSGGYKYSGQGGDAFLVTERHEQQQLTDTSLRRSISDRETRQQVYCTTSVRIGYVAALDSKLPNGFCPVPRYTRTLPCEQMIARCRYTLSEYLQRA